MYFYERLLASNEFINFLESQNINSTEFLRDIAEMAARDSWIRDCSVGIMAGRYLEHLDLTNTHTKRTRRRIASILQRFCAVFGGLDTGCVRASLVSYWIREQGWALATQLWVAVVIERVWQYGVETECLDWNPMDGLRDKILQLSQMPKGHVQWISAG